MLIRVPESAGTVYERIAYPAGELQVRFLPAAIPTLFGTPRISVLCRDAHQHLMELALLSGALHTLVPWAHTTLVLPYLPYARADRRFVPEGDCHGLHTFGEMLNQLRYNAVRTLDVHSFRARSHVGNLTNISPRPFISRAIADICDNGGHPVVLLPDQGANRYGLEGALQCTKKRNAATGALSGFEVPDLDGHDALIVDDICDGGGTFVGLAQAIFKQNPDIERVPASRPRLYLYVTHGIFSRGLKELLQYFEKIYMWSRIMGARKCSTSAPSKRSTVMGNC
jgi:ribose-phosphate pyrophosphokinase